MFDGVGQGEDLVEPKTRLAYESSLLLDPQPGDPDDFVFTAPAG